MIKQNLFSKLILTGRICKEHLSLFEIEAEKLLSNNIKGLNIILNSPGGDASTAIKIVNQITQLKKQNIIINTYSTELVASSALLIYLHGMFRILDIASSIIIDLPFKVYNRKLLLGFLETGKELERLVEENNIILSGRVEWAEVISEKTNQPIENIYNLENKPLSANEALQLGFCHQIIPNLQKVLKF